MIDKEKFLSEKVSLKKVFECLGYSFQEYLKESGYDLPDWFFESFSRNVYCITCSLSPSESLEESKEKSLIAKDVLIKAQKAANYAQKNIGI